MPRYLPGGGCVSCFNGIDVVSRYPTGQQWMTKHSEDAVQFLLSVWQTIGLAEYTQVDNEGCFSGGFTHPGVLGKVVRLALLVGTQLVFSPVRHPESNGTVERFHQDYLMNVWDKVELPDLSAVQAYSSVFFEAYRHSEHQTALRGRSPAELHPATHRLPTDFSLPERLPLTVGQIHFIRRVSAEKRITLLNLEWDVPAAQPDQGVWATLEFTLQGAILRIFDTAPDVRQRALLAEHPLPLKEEIQSLAEQLQRPIAVDEWQLFQPTNEPTLYRLFGLVSTML